MSCIRKYLANDWTIVYVNFVRCNFKLAAILLSVNISFITSTLDSPADIDIWLVTQCRAHLISAIVVSSFSVYFNKGYIDTEVATVVSIVFKFSLLLIFFFWAFVVEYIYIITMFSISNYLIIFFAISVTNKCLFTHITKGKQFLRKSTITKIFVFTVFTKP